jgi:hypothetical protein
MRRAGAATVGLTLTALLVVGLWSLVEPGRRTEPGPASRGTLVGGLAFADGQLLRFTADGTEVVATLPEQIAPEPPVLTRYGVVVLTGRPGVGLRLWLVSRDGSVIQIAEDVTAGFAVDPAADVVAYATTGRVQYPEPLNTTVHIVSLSDGTEVSASPEMEFYAAVRGIADGNVVLSTGDGASASVGLWVQDAERIRRYWMYGNAEGIDPVTGISVLDVGDGQVPILVRFREAPSDVRIVPSEIVVDRSVVQLDGVDFAPGGGQVAGVQPGRDDAELIVIDETSGQIKSRAQLPDGSQTAWSGDDTILVLDKGSAAAQIHSCDLTTGRCAVVERDLPSAGGRFGYGLWLVARSFEVGSSVDGESVSPTVTSTTRCTQATTSGDFDGDGATDEAEFIEVISGSVSCDRDGEVFENLLSQEILIRFGSGQTLEHAFNDCQGGLCAYVFSATDLDGDGRDELAIDVSSGGALGLVGFYRADADAIQPVAIAEPGDAPYVQPGPAILGGGFDSGLQSPVICRVNDDGTRILVSIHAENVGGPLSGPWEVHTTTMVLRDERLVVTSTDDSESSFPGTSAIPSFSKTSPFENGCTSPTNSSLPPASDRPFAVWPEDTQQQAMRAAARLANGEDPWRSDAAATAQHFARTILGWPDLTSRPYEGPMACNMCFVVERADGGAPVVVAVSRLVNGKWWSITWVGVRRDHPLGMSIRGRQVSMSFDRRGADSVDVTVGYGGTNATTTFPEHEEVQFDLGFKPSTPGHFIVLFKDERGSVFAAQGAALPSGDFAAG